MGKVFIGTCYNCNEDLFNLPAKMNYGGLPDPEEPYNYSGCYKCENLLCNACAEKSPYCSKCEQTKYETIKEKINEQIDKFLKPISLKLKIKRGDYGKNKSNR